MNKQTIYYGRSISNINYIIKTEKARNIFVVNGKMSFSSIRKKIYNELIYKKICEFNNFEVNPKILDVNKGIRYFRKFNPDLVIAIGGGSVLDMAKLIRFFAVQSTGIRDFLKLSNTVAISSNIPLIALPTTAGTGSESTHFSVVYDNKKKYSVASKCMLPKYVILDIKLIQSMPPYIASCSLFDALSQAIESYLSKFANEESRQFSKQSMQLILSNFDGYLIKNDLKCQKNIIKASNLAGKAINITKTIAPHALSYTLTTYFKIPHGHAVSILLPETFKISFNKIGGVNKENFKTILKIFKSKSVDDFCHIWKNLMYKSGLETYAKHFGIDENDVNFIASNVNQERLKGHPVNLSNYDLKEIIRNSL